LGGRAYGGAQHRSWREKTHARGFLLEVFGMLISVVEEGWWERLSFFLLFSPAGSASSAALYTLSAVLSPRGLPPRVSARPVRLPRAPCALAPCLPRKAVSARLGAGAAAASQQLKAPPARPMRGSPAGPQPRAAPPPGANPHRQAALALRVAPAGRVSPRRRPCALGSLPGDGGGCHACGRPPGTAHVERPDRRRPCTRSVVQART